MDREMRTQRERQTGTGREYRLGVPCSEGLFGRVCSVYLQSCELPTDIKISNAFLCSLECNDKDIDQDGDDDEYGDRLAVEM